MRCLHLILALLLAGSLPFVGAATLASDGISDVTGDVSVSDVTRSPISEQPTIVSKDTPNTDCLDCHGVKGFAVPKGEFGEGRKRALFVAEDDLHSSVHAEQTCVDCHNSIEQTPHKKPQQPRIVNCVQCHKEQAQQVEVDVVQPQIDITRTMVGLPPLLKTPEKTVLERETGHYLASIHAQARKDDPTQVNATCGDCHGKHDVLPMRADGAEAYRLNTPQICGGCHEKALKAYTNSVHGAAVKRYNNLEAAVCGDCHSAHQIAATKDDPVKLAITKNCGSCHDAEVKTYRSTYHGQVAQLGYAYTAKCADCHAPHNTLKKDNPQAQIHPNNLVETCKECHKQANASYVKFQPHGHSHDFDRFPVMWLTSKFMIVLLTVVVLFFWGHSILWFKREREETKPAIAASPGEKHVRRFSRQVRLAHLLLVIAVMVLALTGTAVLYADSFWAPTFINLLGGPKVAAIIHRVAATLFGVLFFGHVISTLYRIFKHPKEKKFDWFGPDSLVPNKRDWQDFLAMKNWFAGKGPRPVFDRWTYWEKFDYWAPFWGMFIIGVSGIMLWFSPFFGSFLPGWIFNVATIVHGEEAFLAIVFLFTVHFFNSHFRPDKFPLDIVMFTGSVPLEEFKHEHTDEYARMIEEDTLDDYLVDPPSDKMVRQSRTLGFTLIGAGLLILILLILILVLSGFLQNLFG